jgi:uncharacterized membrane protein
MDALSGVVLIAATTTMGLMAGVFGLYTHTVMPGLRRTDDRTFVGSFQAIDRAIINPWFLASYLGALILTAAAALFYLDEGAVIGWVAAAFVLYLATFVITFAVNVPLNNALKAAGEPNTMRDLNSVRTQFNEGRWSTWNLARTVMSTAAFVCLLIAVYGATP